MRKWLLSGLLALVTFTVFAQCLVPFPGSSTASSTLNAITLYDEVNDKTAGQVIAQIQAANKEKTDKPILLYLDSPGGSVLAGGLIIDAMEASRRPIYAIDVKLCASMCEIIFESAAKRLLFPHAILMAHEASAGVSGDLSHMTSQVNLLNRMVDRYNAQVAARAGITVAELKAFEAYQWWMLADDAIAAHMADGILIVSDYPAPTGS